ncbi:MAG: hypothetical protein ACW97A_03385 [Candidatus Thorarchaeota archaeon]|jgi:hypothetical protein
MNLFQACLEGKEIESAKIVKKMMSSVQPAAIWAILIHAAAWHEQHTFDTPHSTILTHSIHRMIEELGPNSQILAEEPETSPIDMPDEIRMALQRALVERLAMHLAAIDHWVKEQGPKYGVTSGMDSVGNLLRMYSQAVRQRSLIGAMEAATGLESRNSSIIFARKTASLAAEEPDNLGHGFIMPVSLLAEIPDSKFSYPHQAVVWHLMEYLVRKVPSKAPEGLSEDDQYKEMAEPTDLSSDKLLVTSAVVDYGILGHNGIFAHRIAEAGRQGLVNKNTIDWLLDKLKRNIGGKNSHKKTQNVESLIEKRDGTDWDVIPSKIELPHSQKVRQWFSTNLSDHFDAMMDLKSKSFEETIPNLKKSDFNFIRAAQYAMSAINGQPRASHVMIYTQAAWSLTDMGLVSKKLATLQVHRMLRQYLKGR